MIESALKWEISKDTHGASKLNKIRFGRISALKIRDGYDPIRVAPRDELSSLTCIVRDESFIIS